VESIADNESGRAFSFYTPQIVDEIKVDDSIAINGVCLTATEITKNGFKAQAVHITLEKTNLGLLQVDEKVNVELSMRFSDRVGGHLVQGHVNDVAILSSIQKLGENYELWFQTPKELSRFLIKEGSVALDGISLTIADVKDDKFLVTIIPHTWEKTQLHIRSVGDKINIEVDMQARMIANYVEHFLKNMDGKNAI
jgi:riboflavin synthase